MGDHVLYLQGNLVPINAPFLGLSAQELDIYLQGHSALKPINAPLNGLVDTITGKQFHVIYTIIEVMAERHFMKKS